MQPGFRGLHPLSSLIFYTLTLVFCLSSTHPLSLITAIACALCYDVKLRGSKAVKFFVKIILPVSLAACVLNGLVNHEGGTVIFYLPGNTPFTLEAVLYGLVFALRASAAMIWLNSFNEVVTNDKIIFLFGRFSPKTALIISMALRFIPLVSAQAEEINTAAKGIGLSSSSDSFIRRITSAAQRLSILVSWTMERGIDTADSMKARGYGLSRRTVYSKYVFTLKDALTLALSAAFILLFIISRASLTSEYIPQTAIPFPDAAGLISSVYFCIFLLFPTILDVTEEKKWSISD